MLSERSLSMSRFPWKTHYEKLMLHKFRLHEKKRKKVDVAWGYLRQNESAMQIGKIFARVENA